MFVEADNFEFVVSWAKRVASIWDVPFSLTVWANLPLTRKEGLCLVCTLVNSPTRVTRPGMVPLLPLIPSLVTCLRKCPKFGYSFNTHPPFKKNNFWQVSSVDIQKWATGITFSTTLLLLTSFCSEVKWRKWRVSMSLLRRHMFIPQSIVDKAVDQWRAWLRACVKANRHHFEHLL